METKKNLPNTFVAAEEFGHEVKEWNSVLYGLASLLVPTATFYVKSMKLANW